jgi:hypothetical protein
MTQPTFAEQLAELPLKLVWVVAVVLAVVLVGIFEPAEALEDVIVNQGLSEEQINAAAFIFGYAAPLCVATAIVVFGAVHGWFSPPNLSGPQAALAVAVVYLIAGYLSKSLGLGLAPAETYQQVSGNPFYAVPVNVFLSYFTSYGLPLMLAGLALGFAAGLQLNQWAHQGSTNASNA